ncbi:MAG: hypothetical protein IPG43_22465 [Proteobacteria bacterium]|nr:hypothetical protein [Pseudomonadota bacterium]
MEFSADEVARIMSSRAKLRQATARAGSRPRGAANDEAPSMGRSSSCPREYDARNETWLVPESVDLRLASRCINILRLRKGRDMRTAQRTAAWLMGALVGMAWVEGAALAAPVVFQGLDNRNLTGPGSHPNSDAAQAAFAAAALAEGGMAVQDFDSLALGAAPASFAVGTVSAALTATATTPPLPPAERIDTYPVSGARFLDSLTNRNTTFFSVTFSEAVSGFGFHITDASDWVGNPNPSTNVVVTLQYETGTVTRKIFDGTQASTMVSGNLGFWGVIDSAAPLTGFSLSNPAGNPDRDAIGIDNLSIALTKPDTPVPLPTSALLLLPAFALVAGIGRRRR